MNLLKLVHALSVAYQMSEQLTEHQCSLIYIPVSNVVASEIHASMHIKAAKKFVRTVSKLHSNITSSLDDVAIYLAFWVHIQFHAWST